MYAYSKSVERQMRLFYGSLSEKDGRRYPAVEVAVPQLSRAGPGPTALPPRLATNSWTWAFRSARIPSRRS